MQRYQKSPINRVLLMRNARAWCEREDPAHAPSALCASGVAAAVAAEEARMQSFSCDKKNKK
jgi:hypothetical protein